MTSPFLGLYLCATAVSSSRRGLGRPSVRNRRARLSGRGCGLAAVSRGNQSFCTGTEIQNKVREGKESGDGMRWNNLPWGQQFPSMCEFGAQISGERKVGWRKGKAWTSFLYDTLPWEPMFVFCEGQVCIGSSFTETCFGYSWIYNMKGRKNVFDSSLAIILISRFLDLSLFSTHQNLQL